MAGNTLFKVVRSSNGARLFEGIESDARHFVESNFPRIHVEPGYGQAEPKPDVTLISPDGSMHEFHGPETGWVSPGEPAEKEEAGPETGWVSPGEPAEKEEV
jgi:hypothetical protein